MRIPFRGSLAENESSVRSRVARAAFASTPASSTVAVRVTGGVAGAGLEDVERRWLGDLVGDRRASRRAAMPDSRVTGAGRRVAGEGNDSAPPPTLRAISRRARSSDAVPAGSRPSSSSAARRSANFIDCKLVLFSIWRPKKKAESQLREYVFKIFRRLRRRLKSPQLELRPVKRRATMIQISPRKPT